MKRTEKLNNELTKLTKIGTTVASIAAIALLAEPVLACGMFPPPDVTTPPPTWIKFNPAGQGVGAFGVQLGDPINPQSAIFVPTEKTNCVCGIAIYDKINPQANILESIPSLNITGVKFAITNTLTNESSELTDSNGNPIFAMTRNASLDNGLANSTFTPDSQASVPPISNNGSNWFAFNAQVHPFTPPTLGANEVFTMIFDVDFAPTARPALEGLGLQFASGSLDQLEEHPVTYSSGELMVMENEKVPEHSSSFGFLTLGVLGIGSVIRRKQRA